MKNLFLYTVLLVSGLFFITSCEKEEIGGTATESMAGEWYVTADAIDADGNIVYEDVFGLGHFHLDTYNSSSNSSTEMWIDDNDNFYYGGNDLGFKTKTDLDLTARTFSATNSTNAYYDNTLTITNGKVLYDAATTPSGMPADSIVFELSISNDTLPATYGYIQYKIAGFRYTGLTGDE
ncbi:lipid-binding protein [Sunxiuqinia indica]|uniref:lipid-binding protein n=1 Tax=Sunxiuqinia indica TaxID=2692584 RepID=UPI00191626C9|nr:lipid-binding protein [Sunxiuqinia indica]